MDDRHATQVEQMGTDSTWGRTTSPAVAELLNHIARELAQEYVRLVESNVNRERLDTLPL